jgi:hypothetical protein
MFTRINVAAAVAAIRQIDAEDRTDRAIAEVAETLHLDPVEVGEIARDVSHEEALFEDRKRELAAAEARGKFGYSDRMSQPSECAAPHYCRGLQATAYGACACVRNRQSAEA